MHGNIILEPQIEYTSSQIRNLKSFYQDFFDRPPASSEAKALAGDTIIRFKELHDELTALVSKQVDYPFVTTLSDVVEELGKLPNKLHKYFLTEFSVESDKWLAIKEDQLDPIRHFMSGPSSELFKEARDYLNEQAPNLESVSLPEIQQLSEILDDPQCYQSSSFQNARSLLDSIMKAVAEQVQQAHDSEVKRIEEMKEGLLAADNYAKLSETDQNKVVAAFENVLSDVNNASLIAVIRQRVDSFKQLEYLKLLALLDRNVPGPEPTYIPAKNIPVPFNKPTIDNEEDLDEYLAAMKKAFLENINAGKRIST